MASLPDLSATASFSFSIFSHNLQNVLPESIAHSSQYPAEAEVLFRPNLKLKVVALFNKRVLSNAAQLCLHSDDYDHFTWSQRGYTMTSEAALNDTVVVVACKEVHLRLEVNLEPSQCRSIS